MGSCSSSSSSSILSIQKMMNNRNKIVCINHLTMLKLTALKRALDSLALNILAEIKKFPDNLIHVSNETLFIRITANILRHLYEFQIKHQEILETLKETPEQNLIYFAGKCDDVCQEILKFKADKKTLREETKKYWNACAEKKLSKRELKKMYRKVNKFSMAHSNDYMIFKNHFDIKTIGACLTKYREYQLTDLMVMTKDRLTTRLEKPVLEISVKSIINDHDKNDNDKNYKNYKNEDDDDRSFTEVSITPNSTPKSINSKQ